ncbi:MAG TPA: acyl carrier protein [Rubrivivax sp.]|jgi:acyl carrier protein|nr:acyl carrier protein [Rubrivivax sp.]
MSLNSMNLLAELLAELKCPLRDGDDPSRLTLKQHGLDSLSVLELLMRIEDRTGVEVPVSRVNAGLTLAELAAVIDPSSSGRTPR